MATAAIIVDPKLYVKMAPIRKLFGDLKVEMVAREAVEAVVEAMVNFGSDLIKKAFNFTESAKRKKVTKDDVSRALKF